MGNIHRVETEFICIQNRRILPEQTAEAMKRYYLARNEAKEELIELQERLRVQGEQEQADIFEAHCAILTDPSLDEVMHHQILDDCMSPENAVHHVYWSYADLFSKESVQMVRDKAVDLIDVGSRMLRILQGGKRRELHCGSSKGEILVVRELLPSEAASLDKNQTCAVIAEQGGRESHAAIIARNKGIPALFGVRNAETLFREGEPVIVDAEEGSVLTEAPPEQKADYTRRRGIWQRRLQITKQYLTVEPRMKDGSRINLKMNLGAGDFEELSYAPYVDGAGLFRTEFLFLERDRILNEAEQFEIYRSALLAFRNKPVTIRTMDVGGEKLPRGVNLPIESNPALGLRGLRFCFAEPEMFRTQLRAVLRASVYGNLKLMFPMVSEISEIRRAKTLVENIRQELLAEGYPVAEHIPVGIMIETPAIALVADLAAREVDFASIGTNDLCQYICAADRMNPDGSQYYRKYHPALFRMIYQVAKAFREAGKPLSICGEIGYETLTVGALIGLGIRRLSVSESEIATVKELLSRLTIEQAGKMAEAVMNCTTAKEVKEYLESCVPEPDGKAAAGS